MTEGRERVRKGVLGARTVPHLQVVDGGKDEKNAVPPAQGRKSRARGDGNRGGGKGGGPAGAAEPTKESTCPLMALGHRGGKFYFLDIDGQEREMASRSMGNRTELATLFVGDTAWLWTWFPKTVETTLKGADGSKSTVSEVVGFQFQAAGEFLMTLCRKAGLYGPHVVLRGPGVWRDDDGSPVVHAGDKVLMRGEWRDSGFRSGDQVWISHPPAPRPGGGAEDGGMLLPGQAGFAAPAAVAQELQARISDLWSFRTDGSEIIVIGLMAVGFYGAAARWRPNGFLTGGTGSGKSLLLDLLRACVPSHVYSTDTTKSGIEAAINDRPAGVFLDEAGDRADQKGAQMLLDLVLSASSNDGTKLLRGTMDGRGRSASVLCSVIMAAVNAPEMGPQHRDRFTLVDLVKPGGGDDHRAAMEAAIAWAKTHACALWGRALEGWKRWEGAREAYRAALAKVQCAPREMDQLGAILASWWVLTSDGVPRDVEALDGVHAIGAFIRGARQVEREDGPRMMLAHLATSSVQQDRSTDRELIASLVRKAFSDDPMETIPGARKWLERNGIKIVKAEETEWRGKAVKRGGPGDGLWFGVNMQTLRALFVGSVWEGGKWTQEMMRFRSARRPKDENVRIGDYSGAAIWLSRADWDPPDD